MPARAVGRLAELPPPARGLRPKQLPNFVNAVPYPWLPLISDKMGRMKPATFLPFFAVLVSLPVPAQVKISPETGKLAIEINGKPSTDFYFSGPQVSKPYLWPLRAATGTYV